MASFYRRQLELRHVSDHQSWWAALCETAADFGMYSMTLAPLDPSLKIGSLQWHRLSPDTDQHSRETIHASFPISFAALDFDLSLRVAPSSRSLESAFRRLSLLARLIDESPLDSLAHCRPSSELTPALRAFAEAAPRTFSKTQPAVVASERSAR
jgi:hypothetical protein